MCSQTWALPPNQSQGPSTEKNFSPGKWELSCFEVKFRFHPQGTGSGSLRLGTEQEQGSVSLLALASFRSLGPCLLLVTAHVSALL